VEAFVEENIEIVEGSEAEYGSDRAYVGECNDEDEADRIPNK
jgi:hypothetical protein